MPITFRQLEVFRAVAETRSFTRASYQLFISQSTVSQHVRELEDSLRVTLFVRNRRNVSLSQAGENLLEHSRKVFDLLEEAEAAAKTVSDPYAGRLSFGCASTTVLYQLPAVLAEYTRKYPNVEVNIADGTIEDVAAQMWSGTLDLALIVLPFSSPGLEKFVLYEEPFVAALPAMHPLAKTTRFRIEDLAGERFILHRQGQNTRKLIDRFLFKRKITPRIAIELAETEAIKAMVARGLGVSVLPASAFLRAGKHTGLKTFPLPAKELRRSLAVIYPKARILKPAGRALIELLEKHFKTPPRAKSSVAV